MRNTNCEKAKCGCRVEVEQTTYECRAKGCDQNDLCVGCVWQCADCAQDHCEQHILDLSDMGFSRYSVYVCRACYEARTRRAPKPFFLREVA